VVVEELLSGINYRQSRRLLLQTGEARYARLNVLCCFTAVFSFFSMASFSRQLGQWYHQASEPLVSGVVPIGTFASARMTLHSLALSSKFISPRRSAAIMVAEQLLTSG
jgi:hypothetical protein